MKRIFEMCQESWREPIAEVSERATNDNSAREIGNPQLAWSNIWCRGFYVPLKNFSLIWRRHYYRWKAQNLGLCSALRAFEQGGIFIRGLSFSCLIRRTAPFNLLLRLARGWRGPILTLILTGVMQRNPLLWGKQHMAHQLMVMVRLLQSTV
jgi:hypothetical protein